MRNSYFLVDIDNCFHIRALGWGDAPRDAQHQEFHEVLSCWRPKPDVWTQPAVAVALATEVIASADAFEARTKRWFASASAPDRLALIYAQRNDHAHRPGAGRELVEAWLLHHAATQASLKRGKTLPWPVPQLAREAWAAQRPVLQEAVAGKCPAAYVPLLLAAGEDVAARDAQGATALHWAAAAPVEDNGAACDLVARALLDAGAEPDAREKQGSTPLTIALCKQNWPTLRTLVNAGAFVSEKQWPEVLKLARFLRWHEVGEWTCRRAARALDGVLARPAEGGAGGRVRM